MRGSCVSNQEHLGFYSIKYEEILDLLRASQLLSNELVGIF
jgi:hypothetical protein